MHWEALIFYAEPRELVLSGRAVVGAADVDVNVEGCVVTVANVRHTVISVDELTHLAELARQGFKARTAYPSQYLNSVAYFLARLGLARSMYKVVAADPWTTPLKAGTVEGLVRNIAYLHGVRDIAITRRLSLKAPKTLYAIHALLKASGYNADETLARRYNAPTPCRARLL